MPSRVWRDRIIWFVTWLKIPTNVLTLTHQWEHSDGDGNKRCDCQKEQRQSPLLREANDEAGDERRHPLNEDRGLDPYSIADQLNITAENETDIWVSI